MMQPNDHMSIYCV